MVYKAYLKTTAGKDLVAVKTVKGKMRFYSNDESVFCSQHFSPILM